MARNSRVNMFARAADVRFGVMDPASALSGLGVFTCAPGYRMVTASNGKQVCITEQKAGGGGTSVWGAIKSVFSSDDDSPEAMAQQATQETEKKYSVSFTPKARAQIDVPGSFGPQATAAGQVLDPVQAFLARRQQEKVGGGIPGWVWTVGGLLGFGLVAAVIIRKK